MQTRYNKKGTKFLVLSTIILLKAFVGMATATSFSNKKLPTIKDSIVINIKFAEAKPNDTLTLVLDNILYKISDRYNKGSFVAKENNKWFRFFIPVRESCGYWTLFKARATTNTGQASFIRILLSHLFWEKGDSITINLSNKETRGGIYSDCSFSGKGAVKYQVRFALDSLRKTVRAQPRPLFDSDFNYYDSYRPFINKYLLFLDQEKSHISDLSYQVLKADIYFASFESKATLIRHYYNTSIEGSGDSLKHKFKDSVHKVLEAEGTHSISVNALANSFQYIHYLYEKFLFESTFLYKKKDSDWIYNQIKKLNPGILRDEVTLVFLMDAQRPVNPDKLFRDALSSMSDENCIRVMRNLMGMGPGNEFYNFELPDVNNKMIKLSDFKGKKVLIDFYFWGCGGCVYYYQNVLSKIEQKYKNDPNVVFISINTDVDIKYLRKSIESDQYTSKWAINLYSNGQGYKHPLLLRYNISPFPFVVLLDKQGKIKYLETSNLHQYNSLVRAIEE